FRGLQARVEGVAAKLEGIFEFVLPALFFFREQVAELVRASAALAAVLDLHPHAVVGEDGEVIRAWLGPFGSPERLQKASRQREQAEQFQERAGGAHATRSRSAAVAPKQKQQRNGQHPR